MEHLPFDETKAFDGTKSIRVMKILLLISMVGYLLIVFGLSLTGGDWFWFLFLTFLYLTGPFAVAFCLCLRFVIWLAERRNVTKRGVADAFSAVLSLVFALICIIASAYHFTMDVFDWEYLNKYTQSWYTTAFLEKLSFASACLALLPWFADFLGRQYSRRWTKPSPKVVKTVRNVLCCLISAAVLLLPRYTGRYNDGGKSGEGSRHYEAVLYEVIDWNRTHEFDGTPRPVEEQRMRVYFFPYNCYDYEAKWALKH